MIACMAAAGAAPTGAWNRQTPITHASAMIQGVMKGASKRNVARVRLGGNAGWREKERQEMVALQRALGVLG